MTKKRTDEAAGRTRRTQDGDGSPKREKLTKRICEAAELPPRPEGLPDEKYRKRWSWIGDVEVPGFGLRVFGSGRKTFSVRYRSKKGHHRMRTLGAFGELTVQEARAMARDEKVKVRAGQDPVKERREERRRQEREVDTVEGLANRWLREYAGPEDPENPDKGQPGRKSWREDQRRIERRIIPDLGHIALTDLTAEDLYRWHRKIGKEAPVEANRCLELLRAAWRWAEELGALPEGAPKSTILRSGKKAKVRRYQERPRARWLREKEVGRLMAEVRKHPDPYIRAAIPLLLTTGLRKMELLKARWRDVDLDRGEITLPETKTGEAQVRVLPSPAVAILRDLPRMQESPWVFPSPANPRKHRSDLKKPWYTIRRRAGLEDATLHDLRRTAGSFMIQNGVPLEVVQQVLGQSHPGVTRIYARLADENRRHALETLSEALAGPLGLDTGEKARPALPAQLRALLEASGDDPEALAEGLRRLGLGKPVDA